MLVRDHKKLARICVIQDVSHRELAIVAGYKSHGHIGQLLRGTKKGLEPEAALRIARRLGMPIDDLFVVSVSTPAGQIDQKVA